MGCSHIKVIGKPAVCLYAGKILRKAGIQIVVNTGVVITPDRRNPDQDKQDRKQDIVLCHKRRGLFKARHKWLMSGLFNRFIKNKNHGRQYGYTTDHTEDNTLCHNKS